MKQVRILIVEPYDLLRRGMRMLLESQPGWVIVAEARDGREAVEQARQFQPDVVIMEIVLAKLNGLDAMRQIREDSPETKVLIYTKDESEVLAHEAIAASAAGYLFKSDKEQDLVAAMEAVLRNKSFFTPRVSRMVLEHYQRIHGGRVVAQKELSPREREILQLVAEGMSTKEIATTLNVSAKTVETHRANIMHKLNLRSLAELVRYAIRNRIITP